VAVTQMTARGLVVAATFALLAGRSVPAARAQAVPPDFALGAEAGPRMPGSAVGRIDVVGTTATLALVMPEGRATGTPTVTGSVSLAPGALACLYAAVTAAGSLAATSPADNGIADGTYAFLRVTAGGTTQTLVARNQAFAPIDDVIRRLNGLVPAASQLHYNAIAGAAPVACP
jgi:hypothetical protein